MPNKIDDRYVLAKTALVIVDLVRHHLLDDRITRITFTGAVSRLCVGGPTDPPSRGVVEDVLECRSTRRNNHGAQLAPPEGREDGRVKCRIHITGSDGIGRAEVATDD